MRRNSIPIEFNATLTAYVDSKRVNGESVQQTIKKIIKQQMQQDAAATSGDTNDTRGTK